MRAPLYGCWCRLLLGESLRVVLCGGYVVLSYCEQQQGSICSSVAVALQDKPGPSDSTISELLEHELCLGGKGSIQKNLAAHEVHARHQKSVAQIIHGDNTDPRVSAAN